MGPFSRKGRQRKVKRVHVSCQPIEMSIVVIHPLETSITGTRHFSESRSKGGSSASVRPRPHCHVVTVWRWRTRRRDGIVAGGFVGAKAGASRGSQLFGKTC